MILSDFCRKLYTYIILYSSKDILVKGICFSAGKKLSNINYFGINWPFDLPIRDFFGYNCSTEKEWANFTSNLSFFAPNLQFDIIKSNKLAIVAAKAFIMCFSEYHDANIVNDYLKYIATQKLKLLPLVLNNDNVEIIQKLAEIKKITYKNAMEKYFPKGSMPEFASKAFSCKEMYRIAKDEGVFVDCVSMGEIYTAISADFDPKHIFFHGNNKTEDELRYALKNAVGRIVIDNFDELNSVDAISL